MSNDDNIKYAYHQGANIIRQVQDRVCEIDYTGIAPNPDEREILCTVLLDQVHHLLHGADLRPSPEFQRIIRAVQDAICEITDDRTAPAPDERERLCDMLIELHQLLFDVTLFPLHEADGDCNDEVYSDGSPVVELLDEVTGPTGIPADAYCSDIGETVAFGDTIRVLRPGEADYVLDEAYIAQLACGGWVWKATAALRTKGHVAWVRDDAGHIVKRAAGPSGRRCAVSAITPEGIADCEDRDRRTEQELVGMLLTPKERHERAVETCMNLVMTRGDVLFSDLKTPCVDLGMQVHGIKVLDSCDHPGLRYWGGTTDEFLDVVDAVLDVPGIRMRRTSVQRYRERGDGLLHRGGEMPVIDGEIAAEGYRSPHWLPMRFVYEPAGIATEQQ